MEDEDLPGGVRKDDILGAAVVAMRLCMRQAMYEYSVPEVALVESMYLVT